MGRDYRRRRPPFSVLVFGARAAPRPGFQSLGDVELFARTRGAAFPSRSCTAGAPSTQVRTPWGRGALPHGGLRHPGSRASLASSSWKRCPARGVCLLSLTRENFTRTSGGNLLSAPGARDFLTLQPVLYFSRCSWRPETSAVRSPNSFSERLHLLPADAVLPRHRFETGLSFLFSKKD